MKTSLPYGFRPEDIQDEHDHFVVEGDQCFSKKDFWENYGMTLDNEFMVDPSHEAGAAADRKHYRYTYLVTKTQTIKIRIITGVPQNWQNAIL